MRKRQRWHAPPEPAVEAHPFLVFANLERFDAHWQLLDHGSILFKSTHGLKSLCFSIIVVRETLLRSRK
jgi:hypothetical protein